MFRKAELVGDVECDVLRGEERLTLRIGRRTQDQAPGGRVEPAKR